MRSPLWALTVPLLISLPTFGQGEKNQTGKRKAPRPNEVEVRLADGSRVRMTMREPNLTVETKYGHLTIPTPEITRIEFGVRADEGVGRRVQEAVKRLGHEDFKERDAA